MTTARDQFVIDFDRNRLINRIRLFKHSDLNDEELHQFFGIRKKKGWDIRKSWKQLQLLSDHDLESLTIPVLYRPFDIRWIFYHDAVVWRTVKRVMLHFHEDNLGIVTSRQTQGSFKHVFISNKMIEFNLTGTAGKYGSGYLFPLSLYPKTEIEKTIGKQSNISQKIFSNLADIYPEPPLPEKVFYYIYGILYSEIYRKKYEEFLKTDFPRIPFTKDYVLFQEMADYGQHLADLHLMKSSNLDSPIVKFQGSGDNRLDKLRYDKKSERVYINKDQYFENVPETIWEYHIGGYQVCQKTGSCPSTIQNTIAELLQLSIAQWNFKRTSMRFSGK